ncbi:hypothetical protein JMA_42110 (plasmid) [Jeotgalibacillus malaysiensis]|uniref:Uncharacterized protein n=1 Tax=Jeotgalibacillus malaysiensis TaxID=1508404 RepID=A0A0B5AYE0_9BACL|nr:hypothetical protein [Jeotgalibacillus malaysiensis]AJD93528.1 hypothetical protein JMA_42110 [Jeotgalibacillus malaysiensis]
MKKGMLLVGKKTWGHGNAVHRVLNEVLGENRKSLMEDKIDNQVFILDGVDERLKEDSLKELVEKFTKLFPNAQVIVSVDSFEVLSEEDLNYAKTVFEVYFQVDKDNYVELEQEDVFVEGIPVRLYLLKNMKDSTQLSVHMYESTLRKALTILTTLDQDVTLKNVSDILHNTNEAGEKLVLEASRASSTKRVQDVCLWFMQDYFTGAKGSRTATKTYENNEPLRLFIEKLVG